MRVHTYHVDDLQQREAKFHHNGGGVILDGPFEAIVIFHQVTVELSLVLSGETTCERGVGRRNISKVKQRQCVPCVETARNGKAEKIVKGIKRRNCESYIVV